MSVSGRVAPMTYRPRQGEIINATMELEGRFDTVSHLHSLGVRLYRGPGGAPHGRLSIDPVRFHGLEGLLLETVQHVRVFDSEHLVFTPPSPLARLGHVRFREIATFEQLQDELEGRWRTLVQQTVAALARARSVASNARVIAHPWRIEGSVRIHYEDLRLLFSQRGDRACVCGMNGRALAVQPEGPRVIIPVPLEGDQAELSALWSRAIAQAETCVAPTVEVETETEGTDAISLDLADQALIASHTECAKRCERRGPDARPERSPATTVPPAAGHEALARDLVLDNPAGRSADMSVDFSSSDLPR